MDWITHFDTFLTKQKIQYPVILFFDGHTSVKTQLCSAMKQYHPILPTRECHPSDTADGHRLFQSTEVLGMVWPKVATVEVAMKAFKKSGIFPFDVNAVNFSRIVKHKGDGGGEGDQDVQEEAAVNILGNVVNEMGDGLEVAIEVEIKTTGANAKNKMQEDEIQTITQSEGTQQENIKSTEQHAVQHSE